MSIFVIEFHTKRSVIYDYALIMKITRKSIAFADIISLKYYRLNACFSPIKRIYEPNNNNKKTFELQQKGSIAFDIIKKDIEFGKIYFFFKIEFV